MVRELYLHSARVFTRPVPSSVLSSCFPLITPGPPLHHLHVFFVCLFSLPKPAHSLPPPHKAPPALLKDLCPPEVSDFPSERTNVYRPSEPRHLKERRRFKEGGERKADKELFRKITSMAAEEEGCTSLNTLVLNVEGSILFPSFYLFSAVY